MNSENAARDHQPTNIIAGPWGNNPDPLTAPPLYVAEPAKAPSRFPELLDRCLDGVQVARVATRVGVRHGVRRVRRAWVNSAEGRTVLADFVWGATGGLAHSGWVFYTASDVRWENPDKPSYERAKKASHRRLGTTGVVLLAGLLTDGVMTDYAITKGWWPVFVAAPSVISGLVRAVRERHERHPDVPGTVASDGEEDYRITHLSEWVLAGQAVESVTGALLAMKVRLANVAAERRKWGWEVTATRVSGDPSVIVKAIGSLETRFDLRVNSLMVQQHREHAARMTLRMITGDPWAAMPDLADPSVAQTIRKPVAVGWRLDQVPALLPILRVQGVILAAPGGGKTELLRAVADGGMRCTDTLLVDIDPTGAGLAGYEAVMWRTARDSQACDQLLQWLVTAAEVRAASLNELGMGTEWQPSPDYPAIVVMVDEFPQLSALGKQLAIRLQRSGRKAGISVLIASQTSDKADAGRQLLAVKPTVGVLGPGCQEWHVQQIIASDARSRGWMPDRLQPKRSEQLNDAGTVYIYGSATPGGDEPIPTRLIHTTPAEAAQRAAKAPERPAMDDHTSKGVAARLSVSQEQNHDPAQVIRTLIQATADREPGEVLTADQAAHILGQGWTAEQVRQTIGDRVGRYGQHRDTALNKRQSGWKIETLRDANS